MYHHERILMGEKMAMEVQVVRFLKRIDELAEDIKAMKKIYRTKRTNCMKNRIEFVEHTLKVNQQFLQLITHKGILPELIQ